jgi:hypothetical protein
MKVKMTKDEYDRYKEFLCQEESKARAAKLERERLARLSDRIESVENIDYSKIWGGIAADDYSKIWGGIAAEDTVRWPLINLGCKWSRKDALSTKVEWLMDVPRGTEAGAGVAGMYTYPEGSGSSPRPVVANFNYTQILRVPWLEWISNTTLARAPYGSYGLVAIRGREKLLVMLDAIEAQMRLGTRGVLNTHTRTAGSVESLLGRYPRKGDSVQFSVLRDMTLRRWPSLRDSLDRDARPFEYEFLIELTWMAWPSAARNRRAA